MCLLFHVSGAVISTVLVKIIMITVLQLKYQFSIAVCSFIVSIRALITADMEYYNIAANYMGHVTFMWSGKFNNDSLESQGIFIIKQSGNPVMVSCM